MSVSSKPATLLRVFYFAVLAATLSAFSSAQDTQKVADLASIEDRVQAVYKQVGPAIVRFAYSKNHFGKTRKLQFGSGVIVSAEGHVAISGPVHAVLDDDFLDLRLVDGRRVRGKALGWSGSAFNTLNVRLVLNATWAAGGSQLYRNTSGYRIFFLTVSFCL